MKLIKNSLFKNEENKLETLLVYVDREIFSDVFCQMCLLTNRAIGKNIAWHIEDNLK